MRAIHLPGVPQDGQSPYSFPNKPPPASILEYTPTFPSPTASSFPKDPVYLISVTTTALTRGELSWSEILDRKRFHAYGGAIPGHDIVGAIHTVHAPDNAAAAAKFKVGDKVWGLLDFDRDGAAAQFALASEHELSILPSPPEDLSSEDEAKWDEQLATLPLSALTAFQALFIHGKIPISLLDGTTRSERPNILLLGPTGSVGLPTLYLSLAANLPTTVLTSARHRAFLESIRDSSGEPTDVPFNEIVYDDSSYVDIPASFTANGIKAVDLIIDCVGSTTLTSLLLSSDLSKVIEPGGKVITIVAPVESFETDLRDRVTSNIKANDIEVHFFVVKPDGAQLEVLGRLARQGKLVGHVDGVFALEQGREAMVKVEEGKRGVGKVVLRVQ